MTRLRTYAPLARRSQKVKDADAEFRAVYAVVDARSEGRCEYRAGIFVDPWTAPRSLSRPTHQIMRCTRRATDHHHLYKPRRSNHEPMLIVHLCRDHHDRCTWPFKRGRLCIALANGRHSFRIRFAADKFAARETQP